MGQLDVSEPAETQMTEAWKRWEGQVVNGEFHLRQYLGGGENSAVFLTEHSDTETQRAAIKLIPARTKLMEIAKAGHDLKNYAWATQVPEALEELL